MILTCSSTGSYILACDGSGSESPLGSLLRRRSDWRVGSVGTACVFFLGLQAKYSNTIEGFPSKQT